MSRPQQGSRCPKRQKNNQEKNPHNKKDNGINKKINSMSINGEIQELCSNSNSQEREELMKKISQFFWSIHPTEIKDYLQLFYYCYKKRKNIPDKLWISIIQKFVSMIKDKEVNNLCLLSKKNIQDIKTNFPILEVTAVLEDKNNQTAKNLETIEIVSST